MVTPEEREAKSPERAGEAFHIMAEKSRETGDFAQALKDADEATIRYLTEGNVIKAAEAQSSRFLTLRHLWETTGDPSYKILAQHAVESSVDMMRQTGENNGLGIPLYNLAKWYDTIGEYDTAREGIKEVLSAFEKAPEDPMGSPSQIAEIRTRLAAIEYRLGDDSAIERFNSALADLTRNPNADDYVQNVWVSGAHMHLAQAMIDRGQKDKAAKQIEFAEQIIGSDSRLILRKRQLELLTSQIS